MARGPVMLGIEGTAVGAADRERLMHPLVGGVILFGRNYEDPRQLRELTAQLQALRSPALLIGVDHEGGRVQRFRDGFTAVPPMRTLGELWDRDPEAGEAEARRWGLVIARELRAHGVDFSFTPVLDVDFGNSAVIGDRAFSSDPIAITQLASGLCEGLRAGGCAAVGKHFPGHGFVAADSHHEVPVDERPLEELFAADLIPFAALAKAGLEAVMPAHVVYPAVDDKPAGFSRAWIEDVLRGRLQFDGLVFSDDLGMAGACLAGDIVARADAAVDAGCDMVLTCNEFDAADDLLTRWRPGPEPRLAERAARMAGR
jgi:beta-N-acetylhexosaminidase